MPIGQSPMNPSGGQETIPEEVIDLMAEHASQEARLSARHQNERTQLQQRQRREGRALQAKLADKAKPAEDPPKAKKARE